MNKDDIAGYSVTERLKDRRLVTIRAIRPDDKGLVVEALHEVSADSIYKRFFAPKKKDITADGLKRVTEVDFVDVVALVAMIEKDGKDHIAGGGRYVRESGLCLGTPAVTGQQKAEVAFLVGDPFQGFGIASLIFKHLVAIARESGITQFEAEVLPWNEAMIKVFTRSGLRITKRSTTDTVQLLIELQGGGE